MDRSGISSRTQDGAFDCLEDARTEIFEYIEMYYNAQRRLSVLDDQSPNKYEKLYFYALSRQVNCP